MTTPVGLARLVRLSIALSPVVDAVAAAALAHASGIDVQPRVLALTCVTSLALYLFGMALNDVCDARRDALVRPDRPIPSGAVSKRSAVAVCLTTLCAAIGFGIAVAHGRPVAIALLCGLIISIVVYDAAPAHLGACGPPLLGAIRGQNLLFGAAALGAHRVVLPASIGYAAYIWVIGWIARSEDGTVRPTRARLVGGTMLLSAIAVTATGAVAGSSTGERPVTAILAAGACVALLAIWLVRSLRATLAVAPLERAPIPRFVGAALSTIFLFHASLTAAAGAFVVAGVLVACHPVACMLARRFPPS